jgi:alpha-beta hydrolase superfamily lysophospholipase
LRDDLALFLKLVRELEPGLPVLLTGFSMGSLVVLDYLLHGGKEISGVIVVSAPLGQTGIPPFLLQVAMLLNRFLPRFSMKMRLDKSRISRDPEVVRLQAKDTYCHGKGSARMGAEYLKCVSRIKTHAGNLTTPLLMLHGSENTIADPEGARSFFCDVKVEDKRFVLYDGGYHELDDDLCKEKVFQDISEWLVDRFDSRQT